MFVDVRKRQAENRKKNAPAKNPEMYETIAAIAAFLLIYTAVSSRAERFWLSGPVMFALAGVILGTSRLGWLKPDIDTRYDCKSAVGRISPTFREVRKKFPHSASGIAP